MYADYFNKGKNTPFILRKGCIAALTNFAVLILFYQNSLTLLTAGTSSQSQP
jgi:hypothetical protein